jgi:hypothetical protein
MTKAEGLDRETAERLSTSLRAACARINEAASLLHDQSMQDTKRRLAEAMTILGWDVLEFSVYSTYPDLRPYQVDRK